MKLNYNILKSGVLEFPVFNEYIFWIYKRSISLLFKNNIISKEEYDKYIDELAKSNLSNLKINEKLNFRTISTEGDQMIIGGLGEIIVGKFVKELGFNGSFGNSKKSDICLINKNGKEIKLEIKTKKQTDHKDPIEMKRDATINDYNKDYQLKDDDYYVFCRVAKDKVSEQFDKVWILGYIKKSEYFNHSELKAWAKGDIDPENNHVYHTDCWNLKYNYLKPMSSFKDEINCII